MRPTCHRVLLLACLELLLVSPAVAQSVGRAGARIGVGTDISGGVAFGGQIDYTLLQGDNSVELGLAFFGGTFEEDSNNGTNDYHEQSDILVVAGIGNYLLGHGAAAGGPYFVVGAGVGAFSIEWREESPTDTSLGSALPGGGSFQEEDGSAAGLILNVGIGHRFSEKFDLRAQLPTFFIGGGENRADQVVPTLTVTAGIAF